jgi:hypothetical protein
MVVEIIKAQLLYLFMSVVQGDFCIGGARAPANIDIGMMMPPSLGWVMI